MSFFNSQLMPPPPSIDLRLEEAWKLLEYRQKEKLNLANFHLNTATWQRLVKRVQFESRAIRSIDFTKNRLDEHSCTALSQLMQMKELEECRLGSNPLRQGCMLIATALRTNRTLVLLDLNNCELKANAANALAQMLEINKTLTSLNLRGNSIGYFGAFWIATALKVNTGLTHLNLSDNKIKKGQPFAEGLFYNQSLRVLDLSKNMLAAADATPLRIAATCSRCLESLDLDQTALEKLSEEINKRLKQNKVRYLASASGEVMSLPHWSTFQVNPKHLDDDYRITDYSMNEEQEKKGYCALLQWMQECLNLPEATERFFIEMVDRVIHRSKSIIFQEGILLIHHLFNQQILNEAQIKAFNGVITPELQNKLKKILKLFFVILSRSPQQKISQEKRQLYVKNVLILLGTLPFLSSYWQNHFINKAYKECIVPYWMPGAASLGTRNTLGRCRETLLAFFLPSCLLGTSTTPPTQQSIFQVSWRNRQKYNLNIDDLPVPNYDQAVEVNEDSLKQKFSEAYSTRLILNVIEQEASLCERFFKCSSVTLKISEEVGVRPLTEEDMNDNIIASLLEYQGVLQSTQPPFLPPSPSSFKRTFTYLPSVPPPPDFRIYAGSNAQRLTKLMESINQGNQKMVEEAVKAQLFTHDQYAYALWEAARLDQLEMVLRLLPKIRNNTPWYALAAATQKGYGRIIFAIFSQMRARLTDIDMENLRIIAKSSNQRDLLHLLI